ncbi:MAG: LysR family transcriptional regulator [Burkholderiales bacterium]|nr:MAG: LysR family transcriptional regulator [Burkholderiales bacterium]
MDLRALRYFVCVVDAGSLSRAAGVLFVAQPALTAQVKRLEDEFGVLLLERSHAGVRPTAAGQRLYEDAVRLLAEADALRGRVLRPAGEPEGTVTLAFPGLLVPVLLGPLLVRIRERHPRIRVFVLDSVSLGVQEAVRDGRADFGLLVDPPQVQWLTLRPVASEAIYFAGVDRDGAVRERLRAPGAGRRAARAAAGEPDEATIRLTDAVRFPLVMQSRRFAIRRQAQEAAASLGLRLDVVHEHDSASVIRALQRSGAGFTFTPGCAVPVRETDPTRVRARIVEPELRRGYALGWLTGRQLDDAARTVLQLLQDEIDAAIAERRWIARPAGPTGDRKS